jgi:ubiquinol-cytochrome c reductase cytochrome c subunit
MKRALALALLAAAIVAMPAAADRGEQLYGAYCIRCHGGNGSGLPGQGPPLQGAGAQAADFYLRTGYMPLRKPSLQPRRTRLRFSDAEISALVGYVASLGGGPAVPKPHPERGDLGEGMRLFTERCAGCHQVAGVGGIVTGARVPSLGDATAVQVAEAVRIGPYVMPRFSRRAISDSELDSIVRYVLASQAPEDRGGWGIGHLGPVPEGLVAWLLAGGVLIGVALLIGGRARE